MTESRRRTHSHGGGFADRAALTRAAFLRAALALMPGVAFAAAAFGQNSRTDRMHTRFIPSSGEALPVIGCGTWRTFDVDASAAARAGLAEVLRVLFDAGGSVIDSSPMYGCSERVPGELLAEMDARDRAFIATKVWTNGRAAGIAQMRESMALLHADPIDLMQVHNLVDWRTHLATLRDWKREGRVRYIGITHYTATAYKELEAALRAEALDFVQLNYALDDRAAEQRLLPLAAERGIAVIVNQPFGGGGLLSRLSRRPLPPWAAEIGCSSWAQLLLKFVLAHPAVTCAIPGTGRPEHMKDNVRAGFGNYPDAAVRARIIALVS
jgi:diketogulonate reductase-like aldo/keto reductase